MKRGKEPSLEQKADAVRRYIAGLPVASLALEFGRTPHAIWGWVADFTSGEAHSARWREKRGVERIVRETPKTDASKALDAFVATLLRPPNMTRDRILDCYRALDGAIRPALAPALDLYLQAADLMDHVRELTRRAAEIASNEISAPMLERAKAAALAVVGGTQEARAA